MAIEKSSAPHAHPLTEDYDDTVEAHYACLERPCCCLEGWVVVNYVLGGGEHGEEREAAYGAAAARKADSALERRPGPGYPSVSQPTIMRRSNE